MKQYVKLTKIKASNNPEYPTPHWNAYKHGTVNENTSLPIDYWVEGYLMRPIEMGQSVAIDRTIRNGEKVSGIMVTSKIIEINGNIFETLNSIYKIEYIKDENK